MAKNKSTKVLLLQFPPPPAVKNEIKDLKTKLIGLSMNKKSAHILFPKPRFLEADLNRNKNDNRTCRFFIRQ